MGNFASFLLCTCVAEVCPCLFLCVISSLFSILSLPHSLHPQLCLTHPSCQHYLPKAMASLPIVWIPMVRLPAQRPAPVASVGGLTLEVIHSGNPPVCSLPGPGPREVTVQEGHMAGKGAVGSTRSTFWKQHLSLASPSPPAFLGSWPRRLWARE